MTQTTAQTPARTTHDAARSGRATVLRRVAAATAWAGAVLGVCGGVVQLTYGSSIPDWTGNKQDTLGLGLVTIVLSVLAGVALWRLLRESALWRRIVCTVVALTCAVICFTTAGALWYLPGPLLIVATVAALLAAWIDQRGEGTS